MSMNLYTRSTINEINLAYLKEHAPSVVTPVIITNQDDKTLTFDDVDSVDPGKRIMTIK